MPTPHYELIEATSNDDWQAYHKIRREVLWEARGRTSYSTEHPDEHAKNNHPLLLKFQGYPIGTTRLDDLRNGTGIVRLVAITQNAQAQGHGRKLSELVEIYAQTLNLKILFVNAAPEALGYYQKLGWAFFVWDESERVGIASDCIQMKKHLWPIAKDSKATIGTIAPLTPNAS